MLCCILKQWQSQAATGPCRQKHIAHVNLDVATFCQIVTAINRTIKRNDNDNNDRKLHLGPKLKSATASLMEQLPEPWNSGRLLWAVLGCETFYFSGIASGMGALNTSIGND